MFRKCIDDNIEHSHKNRDINIMWILNLIHSRQNATWLAATDENPIEINEPVQQRINFFPIKTANRCG